MKEKRIKISNNNIKKSVNKSSKINKKMNENGITLVALVITIMY